MADFTKGPWWTERDQLRESVERKSIYIEVGECWAVHSEKGLNNGELGNLICHTGHNPEANGENRANAHLIAAAPELYEALDKVFGTDRMTFANMGDFNLWFNERGKEAKAALAKARGEK